ncbi:MAG: SDR family oxidoreductase [Myxococcota bacterium]
MRSWRKRQRTVLITGIAGRLGQALTRLLHRDVKVIGLDRRACDALPKDVVFYQLDVRRRKAEDVFRRHTIDALIHLNIMYNPRRSVREHQDFNILGTQKTLDLCQAHGVGKVIMLSSAHVYGPAATNDQFLTEESPLMGSTDAGTSWIRHLIAVDMYCSSFFWRHPEIETVILRPVHILGDLGNAASHYLRLPYTPTVLGYDPMVQVVHRDDVISAMMLALKPGIRGVYNIAGPGAVPLSRLLSLAGKQVVPLPEGMLRWVRGLLWRTRLAPFPTQQIDHIKYVCMVDDSRARTHMRYAPRHNLVQTLQAALGR